MSLSVILSGLLHRGCDIVSILNAWMSLLMCFNSIIMILFFKSLELN